MFAQTILNHTVNSVPFILLIWLHSHWCHLSTSVTLLLLLGSVHVLLKHLHIGSWWLCTLWLRTEAHFLHMSCSALYCSINCWLLTVELYGTPLPPKRLCGNEAMLHLCLKMYKMCKKECRGHTDHLHSVEICILIVNKCKEHWVFIFRALICWRIAASACLLMGLENDTYECVICSYFAALKKIYIYQSHYIVSPHRHNVM